MIQSALYSLVKDGNSETEWEDGAGFDESGPTPRFVVVDGATEAYDSLRWVEQLVSSFLDQGSARPEAPPFERIAMQNWFELMQQRWVEQAPPFADIIEERKFTREGCLASLLGCELLDLDDPTPRWKAMALGDSLLFHVRDSLLLQHFPPLRAQDFGTTPPGVRTLPLALKQMVKGLTFSSGKLHPGDLLFLATDALAHWILLRNKQEPQMLWNALSVLDHDGLFTRLVVKARASQEMQNDDVTLLRVQVIASPPENLVVCL